MHLLQRLKPTFLQQLQRPAAHRPQVSLRRDAAPLLEDTLVENQFARQFSEIETHFQNLLSKGHALLLRCAESGACRHPEVRGPVERMNARLDELEMELKIVRAEYFADAARWRRERRALRKQEQNMGDSYEETFYEKKAAKKRAWNKVKHKFRPVIYKNYLYNEDAIVDYAMTECAE